LKKTDLRLLETAIIITQFNGRFERIRSFRYYVSEIENLIVAKMSAETLDAMLAAAETGRTLKTPKMKLKKDKQINK